MHRTALALLAVASLTTGCAVLPGWTAPLSEQPPSAMATSESTGAPTVQATDPTPATPAATGTPSIGVLVQAHQGGGGLEVAGTAKQFRKAARTDVHMVEFDTQITSDNVIVINHSDTIMDLPGRNCDHDGLRIHTVPYARVKQVRCAGEPLATFEQVLDIFRDTDIRLNVEIKAWDNHFTQPDASLRRDTTAIVAALDDGGYEGRYILSFFDWRVLLPTVRKLHPDLYVIALELSSKMKQPRTRMYQAVRDAAALGADAFEPAIEVTQEGLLEFISAQGMAPQLWYVDTPQDVRFALANGVNPISTNDPVMAKDVIAEVAKGRLVPDPVRHAVRPRTVLSTTLAPGRTESAQVFGWGRVPLAAQEKLATVELEVRTSSKGGGSLTAMPKGGDPASRVSIEVPSGAATTTVLVAPGDLGRVVWAASAPTTMRVRLVGYRIAAYTLKS